MCLCCCCCYWRPDLSDYKYFCQFIRLPVINSYVDCVYRKPVPMPMPMPMPIVCRNFEIFAGLCSIFITFSLLPNRIAFDLPVGKSMLWRTRNPRRLILFYHWFIYFVRVCAFCRSFRSIYLLPLLLSLSPLPSSHLNLNPHNNFHRQFQGDFRMTENHLL